MGSTISKVDSVGIPSRNTERSRDKDPDGNELTLQKRHAPYAESLLILHHRHAPYSDGSKP